MKTLLLLLALAGLSGCATYDGPADDSGAGLAYRQNPAPFIYDRGGYPSGYSPVPYLIPYAFSRPQRFHHGAFAGRSPHAHRPAPPPGHPLAGAVRPPHPNKQ
jgi:hypothetical protein